MPEPGDDEIVHGLKDGDESATRNFHRKYARRLMAFVQSRGIGDPAEAAGLVHDIMLKVIKNINKFDPKHENSFKNYIFTVANHSIIDELRKKSTSRDAYDQDKVVYDEAADEDENKLRKSSQSQMNRHLHDEYYAAPPPEGPQVELAQEILALLPEDERSLLLSYLAQLSYAEISKYHNIKENQVGVRLNRIRKHLEEKARIPGLAERIKDVCQQYKTR